VVAAARKFAAEMGRKGVIWEPELEERIVDGLRAAGYAWSELTDGQRLEVYEAWAREFPWPNGEPR